MEYLNSYLYSLERYNERFDKKIDKAYLEGRYGGGPLFETLFPVSDVKDEKSELGSNVGKLLDEMIED